MMLLLLSLLLAAAATTADADAPDCALILPRSKKPSLLSVQSPAGFAQASRVFGGPSAFFNPSLQQREEAVAPGGDACITFDAINAAFDAAARAAALEPVRGAFTVDRVGELGVVVEETSRILAGQYGLSKDAVANGLPLIDTTRTAVAAFCPPFLMSPKCRPERYRKPTGLCNNLEMPHWGAAMHGHHRFLPPDYADGISAPRVSVTGQPLPSPRLVSTSVHLGEVAHDHAVTMMLVAWGQFIDHEVTQSSEPKDPVTKKTPKCCEDSKSPYCLPIEIPPLDKFYSTHKQKCMNFVRSFAGLRHNCKLGPRQSFNRVTAFLDAGAVYGNSAEVAKDLRENQGGRLRMLPIFDKFSMKNLLPLNLEHPDDGCIRPSEDVFCFMAGDTRVNEQTILAMVHTLMAREHNRIADALAVVNPHWADETLYQETRHILTAVQQHVTYNEFLPMVLGGQVMAEHDLLLVKDGYLDGYDPKVNPSTATSFTTAAFRFGHSLLPDKVERWSKTHQFIGAQDLSGMLLQPYDLYKEGWADAYVHGMLNQVAQRLDNWVSPEVQNHLFQEPGKKFGLDLPALNIQRARELGVPSYNKFRKFCGLPPVRSFEEMSRLFPNRTGSTYANMYPSFEDVDLWSAGVSEIPLPGAMLGPVMACLVAKQFRNFRYGDRFWYENGGWPSSFTLEQLEEIRKVKLSRIICDNGDDVDTVQLYAMVLPDHQLNPRVPCRSGVLKGMDLSKWRDASFHPSPPLPQPEHPFNRPF